MKIEEFYEKLKTLGYEVAYDHFDEGEAPSLPYIIYRYPQSNNFSADGKAYFKIAELDVEIYTKYKDIELEEKVEKLLDELEWFYNKTEDYIETEKMYEVLYEMEV